LALGTVNGAIENLPMPGKTTQPTDDLPSSALNTSPSGPIKHWPATERPRERLLAAGPMGLSDAEILAILIGRGVAGLSAVDLARKLLGRFDGIRGVLNAGARELQHVRGVGPGRAAVLLAARESSRRYFEATLSPGRSIASPSDSREFLLARLRDRPHEVFCCLFLDNRHRVLAFEELFRGTLDNTTVYPREVVKQALAHNAGAVILAHNHPSGVAEPSEADQLITRRIRSALDLVDIRLLDHFVIGDGLCVSLASRGLL
jgi:DNA repair protein RadC